ncbi:MAG: ECF transporter S component [Coriobacteriia bacterium]|nr:ECF transporter S component [Coriobacteriia bacterium]
MIEKEEIETEQKVSSETLSPPRSRTQLLVTTGLLTALVFVVTFVLSIPNFWTGQGIINLGDSAIASSALLLPHPLLAFVGGVGSALANIANPLAIHYAPATLIIKGLMGFVLYLFVRKGKFGWFVVGVVLAELIMLAGYFLYEYIFLLGAGAIANIPGNSIQAGTNFALALLLFAPLMALRKALWSGANTTSGTVGLNRDKSSQKDDSHK